MSGAAFSEGYATETDEGPAYVRPMDVLLSAARMVPREHWQTCPQCAQKSPLFFGDPKGEHWCAACQVLREHPELEEAAVRPPRQEETTWFPP